MAGLGSFDKEVAVCGEGEGVGGLIGIRGEGAGYQGDQIKISCKK